MKRPHRPSSAAALLALAALAPLPGCSGVRPITETPGYPAAAAPGETLNIQVFRDGTELRFTNTTARAFGPSTLWLNRWYARGLDALAPGESVTLPLREFRDRYGEAFRAGGFFAIQRPDVVAVAELETGEGGGRTMLPLVVVGGGEE